MATYTQIIAAIRSKRLGYLESTLDRLVCEEVEVLSASPTHRGTRRTRGYIARVSEDAQSFWAEDISEELRTMEKFDVREIRGAERVLSHRRYANAWAVAKIMHEQGLTLTIVEATEVAP